MTARIQVLQGDITQLNVDVIVNAANPSLMGAEALMAPFIVPQAQRWKRRVPLCVSNREHVRRGMR